MLTRKKYKGENFKWVAQKFEMDTLISVHIKHYWLY